MKTNTEIATEIIKPLDPNQFKDTGWGQTIFFTVVGPIVLLCASKLWERIQNKDKIEEKKQTSELSRVEAIVKADLDNKNNLFAEFQKQYNVLLQEIIGRNDEALKDIQATLATTVGVLATLAENQKTYAELALKRSEETREILSSVKENSDRTIIESFNSHIRINQENLRNQEKIINLLQSIQKRLDKFNVPSSLEKDE